MGGRAVGNRRYSDPDVVSLIDRSGRLIDPYSVVRNCVDSLLGQLNGFEVKFDDPLQRICILASLTGFQVRRMDGDSATLRGQDAIIVPSASEGGRRGTIFYNAGIPAPRIVFSIAHEITHSFFPASEIGARFRSLARYGSRGGRELEMLCHFGASELTMPRADFRRALKRHGFGLGSVDAIRGEFGTSFEACLYRMAQLAPFAAAAGLFRFRFRVCEADGAAGETRSLFSRIPEESGEPSKKYRRQSFYHSESFPKELVIPWNKSVPETSAICRAGQTATLQRGPEEIPVNGRGKVLQCQLEAVPAPYQPEDGDSDHPDVLFLLIVNSA